MVIQNDDKENEDKAVGLDFLKSDWDKYPPDLSILYYFPEPIPLPYSYHYFVLSVWDFFETN